jgi:hypothetical protein
VADIVMTKIRGTTHHYRHLIDVDPANLEPTIDLMHYLDPDVPGQMFYITNAIQTDRFIEDIIEAEFEAKTTSVKYCQFKPGSYNEILGPSGKAIERTIQLEIQTISPVVEPGAVEMKFEFLHSAGR